MTTRYSSATASLELRGTSEEGLEEDGGDGAVGFYQVSKHAGHTLDISCGLTGILTASKCQH